MDKFFLSVPMLLVMSQPEDQEWFLWTVILGTLQASETKDMKVVYSPETGYGITSTSDDLEPFELVQACLKHAEWKHWSDERAERAIAAARAVMKRSVN